jgi:hypothetical protein
MLAAAKRGQNQAPTSGAREAPQQQCGADHNEVGEREEGEAVELVGLALAVGLGEAEDAAPGEQAGGLQQGEEEGAVGDEGDQHVGRGERRGQCDARQRQDAGDRPFDLGAGLRGEVGEVRGCEADLL